MEYVDMIEAFVGSLILTAAAGVAVLLLIGGVAYVLGWF